MVRAPSTSSSICTVNSLDVGTSEYVRSSEQHSAELHNTSYQMDDPIDSAFQSRRFAHGKSKGKSGRGSGRGGGGASKPFNPLAALGRYDVSLGAGNSTSQHIF